MNRIGWLSTIIPFVALSLSVAAAAPFRGIGISASTDDPAKSARGKAIYESTCAACHEVGVGHAPATFVLRMMAPGMIYRVLTIGPMRVLTQNMSDADKEDVAEYLAGKNVAAQQGLSPPACQGNAAQFDYDEPPAFDGWGLDVSNHRDVPASVSGLDKGNIGRLKLKWALGVAGGTRMRSQPAIAGGAIYVGTDAGTVYALDRQTGCQRWMFSAVSEVRTGIVVTSWQPGDHRAQPIAYFGDMVGNVYAVNAITGATVWTDHVDDHPSAQITSTPVLYAGRLYVPVSSLEEGTAADPAYPCCTFRGSVVAYDAGTGRRLWQRYMLEKAKPQGKNEAGTPKFGPAGVAVWSTPAVDKRRGLLYFGTGDDYTVPATATSDSMIALDLKSGAMRWAKQLQANDTWNVACIVDVKISCPEKPGKDTDFGAAAILADLPDGRQLLLAGQKSGAVYALDASSHDIVWETKVGRGGISGGILFGMALHGSTLLVPVNDAPDNQPHNSPANPGLFALDARTGKLLWSAPNTRQGCQGKPSVCSPGISAAPTATGDVVLTGGDDGLVRIDDAKTGELLWHYDTTAPVVTVGGGRAAGGAIGGGASPLAYGGMLVVESGYGFAGNMPGNVMLVFDTK